MATLTVAGAKSFILKGNYSIFFFFTPVFKCGVNKERQREREETSRGGTMKNKLHCKKNGSTVCDQVGGFAPSDKQGCDGDLLLRAQNEFTFGTGPRMQFKNERFIGGTAIVLLYANMFHL